MFNLNCAVLWQELLLTILKNSQELSNAPLLQAEKQVSFLASDVCGWPSNNQSRECSLFLSYSLKYHILSLSFVGVFCSVGYSK